jgi:hypothetical protein
MRLLTLLPWLLRVQVMLGLVQFIGMFAGFAWPPPVWAAHRVIALVAPAVALFAFRRSAWTREGRTAPRFAPGVRVAARFALLAPLALGLCFSIGLLWGRGWAAGHIAVAIAAMMVIEQATRSAPPQSGVRTSTIQLEEMTGD